MKSGLQKNPRNGPFSGPPILRSGKMDEKMGALFDQKPEPQVLLFDDFLKMAENGTFL